MSVVTSGFTRMPTDVMRSSRAATAPSSFSSSSDSTFTCPMPAATASSSSSAVLPTPLKTMAPRGEAGGERPAHLPGGDEVGAGAEVVQQAEDGQVAVRLDRVADPVGNRRRSAASSARNCRRMVSALYT